MPPTRAASLSRRGPRSSFRDRTIRRVSVLGRRRSSSAQSSRTANGIRSGVQHPEPVDRAREAGLLPDRYVTVPTDEGVWASSGSAQQRHGEGSMRGVTAHAGAGRPSSALSGLKACKKDEDEQTDERVAPGTRTRRHTPALASARESTPADGGSRSPAASDAGTGASSAHTC